MGHARAIHSPRKQGGRQVTPTVLILGDGESERVYFEGFRKKDVGARIRCEATGETGMDKIAKKAKIRAKEYGLNVRGVDRVAIVTDLDDKYNLDYVRRVDAFCRENGIELYLSNPCLEVWLLMHFGRYSRSGCAADMEEELDRIMHGYRKSAGIGWDLPMLQKALENAESMYKGCECTAEWCCSNNPSTMVHRLVQTLPRDRAS